MIKKIIKIKGVGKYLNYNPKAITTFNGELKNLTLIYGENGTGKTTITSIIRSLKDDNELINRRKSFTHYASPEIQFLIDGINKPFLFANNKWELHYSNIEVFDEDFINANVYTGSEISSDHKKKLFDVVLGKAGVDLKNKIEEIKIEIQATNNKLKAAETEIQTFTNSTIDGNTFCLLSEDLGINTKIANKKAEILTGKESDLIKKTGGLSQIEYKRLLIDILKLKGILEKSLDNISSQFIEKVKRHKNEFPIGSETESWIKKGHEGIKDNKCPFCERKIDESINIIKAYNQYFNIEYIKLQEDAKIINVSINEINLPLILSEIELTVSNNTPLVNFWKNHTTLDFYDEAILQQKESLCTLFEEIKSLMDMKINDPLAKVHTDKLDQFEMLLSEEIKRFDEYNKIIESYNTKILVLKNEPSKIISELELELRNLDIVNKRFSPDGLAKANSYIAIEGLIKRINYQKDIKQKELKDYTTKTLANYKTKINQLLKKFASYLEIKEIKSAYSGSSKTPQVEYVLSVSGSNIKLHDDKMTPAFKYVLSAGDKSALALAFFLATLLEDPNLKDKIIVFDDPISSFDFQRKNSTIKSLEWVSRNTNQLIILTHNLNFAGSFYENCSEKANLLALQIINDNNTSHLCEFDIEQETLSGLLKDYNYASRYLNSGSKNDFEKRNVARCIRPIVEGFFRIKFFGEFNSNDWLGGFIKKINESKIGDKLNRLLSSSGEIEEINDYSKKYHHCFHPTTAETEPINDTELRNYVERTFQLIERI